MPWWQAAMGMAGTLRDWFRKRPRLKVLQKEDRGYQSIDRNLNPLPGETYSVFFTVLVANQSDEPNTIIKYEVDATLPDGTFEEIEVEQGSVEGGRIPVGVTPVNLPPHHTHEAHIWIPLDAKRFPNPLKLNVTVIDKHENSYYGFCKVPNPYSQPA